ncbi:hypothetical protein LT493_12870 [Streptomyces tricolor]|nr:hypothetical protein [Streptomyces tricolor]
MPRRGEHRRAAGEGGLQAGRRDGRLGRTHGGKYVLRGGAIVAWYVPEGAEPHTPSTSSARTPTPRA